MLACPIAATLALVTQEASAQALAQARYGFVLRNQGRSEEALKVLEGMSNWADQWSSNQYPMRPERILSELKQAIPEDGFIVTDDGITLQHGSTYILLHNDDIIVNSDVESFEQSYSHLRGVRIALAKTKESLPLPPLSVSNE